MSNARDVILDSVRAALADGQQPSRVQRAYRTAGTVDPDVSLFVDRVRDYRARVRLVDDVAAAVRDVIEGALVVPADIDADWLPAGIPIRIDTGHIPAGELDTVGTVVTACALAIAETGTIVLDHSEGQGRRALTLVPDHHVVVVRADQIVATVPDAVARLDPSRPLTWISGPSATSDIELSRVEGVHGPRRLDVLVVVHPQAPRTVSCPA